MEKKILKIDRPMILVALLLGFSLCFQGLYAQRIVSLAPSLTKNMYLLEAEDLLVGCTNYCSLQSETDAEVVANAVQVNYEKIILLQPDLIITTDLTKSKTIDTFRKLGIKVVVFPNPKDHKEIFSQFIELGHLIGKKTLAESKIQKAREELERILTQIPVSDWNPTIFMQIGANPLFGVTPGSFMHDYIYLAGGRNILEDLSLGNVGMESVLVRDPEIIIVVLMGNISQEQKELWERYSALKAVRNDRVFSIGADDSCSPTPFSFVRALREIVSLVYGITIMGQL